jgi:phosphatidylglycerophosphate synthase
LEILEVLVKKMQEKIDVFKKKFDKFFKEIALFFVRMGFTPNGVSIICLVLGLLAVYFLFKSPFLFFIFMFLHLSFDRLDGVIARVTNKVTKVGEWLDYLIDTFIAILIFIKCFFFLNEFLVLLALLYFVLHHGIFIITKNRKYLVGSRTIMGFIFMFGFFNLGLVVSIFCSFLGLVFQIKMFLKKEDLSF